jgi:hypothetical protein
MSRSSSAETFGGSGEPSGVYRAARCSAALPRVGLKWRMPNRARAPLDAVHKPRAFPDQALALPIGPLGILFGNRRYADHAAMAPFPTQPPQEPRLSNSVSSRSVFARRCSRDTATLEGWITCASTPRASSQRASQKPSRPASKASAIRVIVRPALTASSRQRCSSPSSRSGLGSSFLRG